MNLPSFMPETEESIREWFSIGRFPVTTVDAFADWKERRLLGLIASRGFDPEAAFYGMLLRAAEKGAHGIVGYRESIAFHPDGSRFYSCCGTAFRMRGIFRR